jgi:hypothetical protein
VKYWVSAGLPLVEVPDVIGLPSGDAAALEDAGFTVNVDLVAGLGSVPGDVIEQDPAAGTKLGHGAEVTIKVALFQVRPRACGGRRRVVAGLHGGLSDLDAASAVVPSWDTARQGTGRSSSRAGGAPTDQPQPAHRLPPAGG